MNVLSIIIPSNQEFDNTINKILQGSDYKHLRNGVGDFIQNSKDIISQWIQKIFRKTISSINLKNSVSDNLATVFIIIALILIALIVILIIVKLSKSFERKERIKEILGEKIHDKTTPSSLRSLAISFEVKDDYRQAIRYYFISILLLMHEKSIIYLDETKTNEEIYKCLLQNKFSDSSVLEYVIIDFNSSWYGHKIFNKETYDKTLQNINLLWKGVLSYEEKK
ncbi:hypothetical protein [Clostridium estertheticum]|uniref:hypothetical protein n=1 Tax=Clostridium estertheticum TaxID=238834 RepID=UPI001C0DEA83|nr:hypothetical protein [Clostridium estertheticum]MBU3074522.1 hypothetical protein [Clostridium estertheticum]MBU3165986.1 hypothetical protein [Clostridium estertheticum]MBU3173866.1 hypothetical protein [Clostridium estertheticum]MBU3187325.1 hypothetical protein [Clostridium estertheticum]